MISKHPCNILLIAPHPDDELIGCFVLLERRLVRYVHYLDIDTDEYQKCSDKYGFDVLCDAKLLDVAASAVDIVLAPDPHERHPLHKEAYVIGRRHARDNNKMFGIYSTQMDASYVDALPKEVAFAKRDALNSVYGSKSDMWKYEHKYWLYEGVVVRI